MEVLAGKQKGREIPLPATFFVIGRDPLCHLRPHSAAVSRRHCAIARWGEKVLVRDLKSANGTFVNDTRIAGQVLVQDGDKIRVGDLLFAIHIKTPHVPVPAPALDEQSIRWLMDNPEDSAVLDAGMDTALGVVASVEKPSETGSKSLSAGKYLRDYFQEQKKAPKKPR
jgi:predicted component of type VI protein secretion system